MSAYELIPEEAFADLPQDAPERFVNLVRIAQGNLARLLDNSDSGDFSDEIRAQFVSIVSGIADELGIEGLPDLQPDQTDYRRYQTFQIHLAGVTARVRLRGNLVARPHSVELGRVTKARIQQEIEQLRRSVDQSDLPSDRKSAMNDKLNELETELTKRRLSFAQVMAIAASIAAISGGTSAALANAPKAMETVTTIIRLIGEDKVKEEEERLRLMPPPKALPDFSVPAQPKRVSAFDSEIDDDVPF